MSGDTRPMEGSSDGEDPEVETRRLAVAEQVLRERGWDGDRAPAIRTTEADAG